MNIENIKFRGKRIDNGEWVYGWYAPLVCNDRMIIPNIKDSNGSDWKTKEETVGQYTGLVDKNGKEIYEGDIVAFGLGFGYDVKDVHRGVVYYEDGSFRLGDIYSSDGYNELGNVFDEATDIKGTFHKDAICEVVGNIHENPELLEVE